MTRKQRHLLTRIIVAAVLFLAGSLLHLPELAEMAVFLVCYVVVGWDIVWKAITNILHGQVFDENFLMTIATIGALILGEHSEGVAVMLFYQVGEWFQSYAVSKSRKSIASLMDIRPDYANIERDGKLVQVDPDEVQIGETIVVKPGERIPLDGTILKGFSTLDTSALTGESMPREVEPGMEVISGCINQTGILNIQTTKEFGESTVAKILDLVENASDKTPLHLPEHLIKITRIINAAKVRNLFNGRIAVPEQFLGIIDLFCQDILDDRRSKFFFKFP